MCSCVARCPPEHCLALLQALALNVFEARYRLMIRRCLDGDRRFGMLGAVQPVPAGMKEIGCEVEIQDSRQLHDGRYHIQVRVSALASKLHLATEPSTPAH
jgi:Lon protease-like protein